MLSLTSSFLSRLYPFQMGGTVLHVAVEKGFGSIIELLITQGADLNAHNKNKATPLTIACLDEKVDAARVLINAGCNINFRGKVRISSYIHNQYWRRLHL